MKLTYFEDYRKLSIWIRCALKRNTHRKPLPNITYADKNTSPIIFPPLKREELQKMFREYLNRRIPPTDLTNHKKYAI